MKGIDMGQCFQPVPFILFATEVKYLSRVKMANKYAQF